MEEDLMQETSQLMYSATRSKNVTEFQALLVNMTGIQNKILINLAEQISEIDTSITSLDTTINKLIRGRMQ